MERVNVLVAGNGSRECSIVWKMLRSPTVGDIYAWPDNPEMEMWGCKCIPLPFTPAYYEIVASLAQRLNIGLVVIGPENALASRIVEVFKGRGIPVFAPEQAWIVEASKVFSKRLMWEAGIPTAPGEVFTRGQFREALDFAAKFDFQVAAKADGLALGKGVRTCTSETEVESALDRFWKERAVGDAGNTLVIEELLAGREFSAHVLCNGTDDGVLFPFVRDHKRVTDDPKSDMTGGMGVSEADEEPGLAQEVMERFVRPCLKSLRAKGMPFVGCLYPGLMITEDGVQSLEYNARFGRPECEWYMWQMGDGVDLVQVLLDCAKGKLNKDGLDWKKRHALCVVGASEGYPNKPVTGDVITIDPRFLQPDNDPLVFLGGVKWKNGRLVTSGGRVASLMHSFNGPQDRTRAFLPFEAKQVEWRGLHYRRGIGA